MGIRVPDVGAVVVYDGKLVEVVGIADGRTIVMQVLGEGPCHACGRTERVHLLEDSPLFQKSVRPVPTAVTT